MAGFAKWLGGGLGWAFMGPLGGLLGFALGSIVDSSTISVQDTGQRRYRTTTQGDFLSSLIVLIAAVMKSDGKVMKSELDYIKHYFSQAFNPDMAREALQMLKQVLDQNIPVEEISRQIGRHMDQSSRLQLIHLLFGLSKADGAVQEAEIKIIEKIAYYMGISTQDFLSVKALFHDDLSSAYQALEVDPAATNEEVKKAYRRMAVKYHPDKVAYLGDEIKATATEKLQQLNMAYDRIKKSRGMN